MRRKHIRAIIVSVFLIVITTFNFLNLSGIECIRAIHVINLLVCGLGIGLFLENLIGLLREKRN
jgi:hypothetical protein